MTGLRPSFPLMWQYDAVTFPLDVYYVWHVCMCLRFEGGHMCVDACVSLCLCVCMCCADMYVCVHACVSRHVLVCVCMCGL